MTTILHFSAPKAAPAPLRQTKTNSRFHMRGTHQLMHCVLMADCVSDIETENSYDRACHIYGETLRFLHTLKD